MVVWTSYRRKKALEKSELFEKIAIQDGRTVVELKREEWYLHWKDALQYYEGKLDLNTISAKNLVKQGVDLWSEGKWEEALQYFEKALIADPKNVDALSNIAICYTRDPLKKMGFKEAIKCYDQILSVNPDHIGALINKAVCLIKLNDNKDCFIEAIRCYDKVIRIRPNDVEVLRQKGVLFRLWKKYYDALECFNKVLAIEPNSKEALLFKAEILLTMGKNKRLENGPTKS